MEKRPYVGMRIKALLAVVLLVFVPSVFLVGIAYEVRNEAASMVKEKAIEEMNAEISNETISVNRNATSYIEIYMDSIEIEGRSAANTVPDYMGNNNATEALWGSKRLLEQVNITMLEGIMNGSINNSYYTGMVSETNKSYVDSVLSYFINPPELDYSTPHVNESAYIAINDLKSHLGNHGRLLYDFLHSVLLPDDRGKLDRILPVGNMLYSFREVPDLLWSYFTTPDGYFVLTPSDAEVSPLFNTLVRKWYADAVDNRTGTWSVEYIDEITKQPVVTFSIPVYRNGSLLGVLGFDILLSTLSEKAKQFYTGGKSFAFTVAPDGMALTYPNEALIGKSLINGGSDFNKSVRNITEGKQGVLCTYIDGKKVFMAYSTIGSTGWKFVNVVFCEDIMQKSENAAESLAEIMESGSLYLLLIIFSVGLIAFVTAFFVVDSYVRDIKRLINTADEISKGNLDVDVKVDAKDELGDLQKAIKRMVNSIKVAMEELERREK